MSVLAINLYVDRYILHTHARHTHGLYILVKLGRNSGEMRGILHSRFGAGGRMMRELRGAAHQQPSDEHCTWRSLIILMLYDDDESGCGQLKPHTLRRAAEEKRWERKNGIGASEEYNIVFCFSPPLDRANYNRASWGVSRALTCVYWRAARRRWWWYLARRINQFVMTLSMGSSSTSIYM